MGRSTILTLVGIPCYCEFMRQGQDILLAAHTLSSLWAKEKLSTFVIERALGGHYGFMPTEVFVNDDTRGRSLSDYRSKLLRRIEAKNIESLSLTCNGYETVPVIDVYLSELPTSACVVTVQLPSDPQRDVSVSAREFRAIAERLVIDARALFLRGHEYADWRRLHRERRGHLLFVPGVVDGAYWLTYLCDEYVARLGGEGAMRAAPVHEAARFDKGMLLQSHVDFLGFGEEPRKSELEALHTYLASLVKKEERP